MSRKNKRQDNAPQRDLPVAPDSIGTPPPAAVSRWWLQQSFTGPLPPPQLLKQYDEVIPGGAERIFKMAEQQSSHRQALEKQAIVAEIDRANRGLIWGGVVALAALAVSGIIAVTGHTLTSAILAVADVGTLAGVFVYGTRSRKEERIEKAKVLTGQTPPTGGRPLMGRK